LTEYQHIECQRSSEDTIYEGRNIVELDLRQAQTRQKFANSSRIHEDLPVPSLCLLSLKKQESSEEA